MKKKQISGYISLGFLLVGFIWLNLAYGWVVINLGSWKFAPAYLLFSIALFIVFLKKSPYLTLHPNNPVLILFMLGLSVLLNIFPGSLSGNNYDFLYISSGRISLFIIALMTYITIDNDRKRKILLGVSLGIMGILVILGLSESLGFSSITNLHFKTISGTFNNPNLFAGVMILYIPLAVMFFFYSKSVMWRTADLILIICSVIVIFLTGCRSAIVGLSLSAIIGVILYLKTFYTGKVPVKVIFVLSGSLLAIMIVIALILPSTREKIAISAIGGEPRFLSFSAALRMWLQNSRTFFFGNGIGSFRTLLPQFSYPRYYSGSMISSWHAVHNEFLELLVEGGIFSLIPYLAFIFLLVKQYLNKLINSSEDRFSRHLSLALILTITAFVTDSMFSTNLREMPNAGLFYIISLMGINREEPIEYVQTGKWIRTLAVILISTTLLFTISRNMIRFYTDRVLQVSQIINNESRSLELMEFAHKVEPSYIVPPMMLARDLMRQGDFPEFFPVADTIESIIPSFLDIHYLRGQAHTALNQHQSAIDEYEKHLNTGYYDLKAETALLFSHLWTGNDDGALKRFKRIVELDKSISIVEKYIVTYSDINGINIKKEDDLNIEIGELFILKELHEIASGPVKSRNRQFVQFHAIMLKIYKTARLEEPQKKHFDLFLKNNELSQSLP